jgi:hypothetical protein
VTDALGCLFIRASHLPGPSVSLDSETNMAVKGQ